MARHNATPAFLWAAIYCFVILYTVNILPFRSQNHIDRRQEEKNCTAELSKDLYGLGVRLGVYFQWFSGWISNNYIVDEVSGGLDANAIFLFAILVSMVSSTKSDELGQIDALIMLLLGSGTVWGVMSIWGYRTLLYRKEQADAIKRFGGFGTHLRLVLSGAVAWYLVWFWSIGIKGVEGGGLDPFGKTHPPECTEVTVFSLPIRGNVKYVTLTLGIAVTAYNVVLTLVSPLAGITRVRKFLFFWRHGQVTSSTRLRFATVATPYALRKMSCWFGAFNFVWMLFVAVLVEIVLNENKMIDTLGAQGSLGNGDIAQPGQLLPLLIGTFSFVRVLYTALELARSPDQDTSPSLGRDVSPVLTRDMPKPAVSRAGRGEAKGFKGHLLKLLSIFNILKLFSAGYAQIEHSETKGEDGPFDPEYEAFLKKVEKMSVFKKVILTWVPWLTLLYFWPWTEPRGIPVSQNEDHSDQVPLQTSPRGRYSEWDDGKLEGLEISYRGVSRTSIDEGPQHVKPMV